MSSRRNRSRQSEASRISDDQIADLVSKLQQLIPEIRNRRRSDKVKCFILFSTPLCYSSFNTRDRSRKWHAINTQSIFNYSLTFLVFTLIFVRVRVWITNGPITLISNRFSHISLFVIDLTPIMFTIFNFSRKSVKTISFCCFNLKLSGWCCDWVATWIYKKL